jgi:hypothetical protein
MDLGTRTYRRSRGMTSQKISNFTQVPWWMESKMRMESARSWSFRMSPQTGTLWSTR